MNNLTIKDINDPNLVDETKPWGIIKFIHKDGKEHEFYSCINSMSGNRLSAFDSDPPYLDESIAWIKSVFRDIHKKSIKVIDYGGKLAQPK